jgi:glyceraldehyde 3-phosphate dehydrogenase
VLDEAFGVEEGFFTSVHAYTNEQSLIDAPSSHTLRLSRAAMESIVPVESWTATAIQQMFPKLEGKFAGGKLNVPVPDASCADLVTTLSVDVNPRDVNEVFRSAAGSTLRDLMDYTEEPIVSRDVVGSTVSCLFDSQATMVVDGRMVKTLGWYDQGGGLAFRIVDVIRQLGPRRAES